MRDRIMQAVIEEINLRGFKFTMEDLTRRLRVSKSTLYRYFSSKEEIFDTILAQMQQDFQQQEQQMIASDRPVVEKIEEAMLVTSRMFEPFQSRVYDEFRTNYPEKWETVRAFRQRRLDLVAVFIRQGIAEGTVRPVNIRIVQAMISSTMEELVSYPFLRENNLTLHDAMELLLEIILKGLIIKK